MKHTWSLHLCALDHHCRKYAGWCWRLELNTPWFHFGLALRPADRYARTDGSDWISFRRWPS